MQNRVGHPSILSRFVIPQTVLAMADDDLYRHCDAHVLTDTQRILFRAEVKKLAKEMAGRVFWAFNVDFETS